MIRDRRTLISIVLADMFVMLGAAFVMQDRYHFLKTRLPAVASTAAAATAPQKASNAAVPAPIPTEKTPAPAPSAQKRNILFSYRNSKPSRVEVIGSFNNWTPQLLKKGPNHTWSTSFSLEPGDYTYNYVVDGRAIRDPNNPRTAPEGRSLLTVKPIEK